MSVGQYQEVEYASRLRDLFLGDLEELNLAVADEVARPMVEEDIVVGPVGVQISDLTLFVVPGGKVYPNSPTQAELNTVNGVVYPTWCRHVHGTLIVQPQATFVPDSSSVQHATRVVCKLSDTLDMLFLRYIKLADWWAWLDVGSFSSVAAIQMPGTNQLVAAKQCALTIRVKERVDTRPTV